MAEKFDPYRKWLGIPPEEQPVNHYRLLGLALFEADADVIAHAADRQMAHVRTFQIGKYSKISQKLLNRLADARVCLLDPEKKGLYDADLRKLLSGKPGRTVAGPAAPAPSSPPLVGQTSPADVQPDASAAIATIAAVGAATRQARRTVRSRSRKKTIAVELIIAGVVLAIIGIVAIIVYSSQPSPGRRGTETHPGKHSFGPLQLLPSLATDA
jgi:hypothetical protein